MKSLSKQGMDLQNMTNYTPLYGMNALHLRTSTLRMMDQKIRGCDGWMASLTQWHESEQAPVVGGGQGGLACCSPLGHKESGMTE